MCVCTRDKTSDGCSAPRLGVVYIIHGCVRAVAYFLQEQVEVAAASRANCPPSNYLVHFRLVRCPNFQP